MICKTNPYRNGILNIFDSLCVELKWEGIKKEIARSTLKSALAKGTEDEAKIYLNKMKVLIDELCLMGTQLKH